MNVAVPPPRALTEAEWKLVIELLERERGDLPSEIHHTRTPAMRDELHQRLALIQGLLRKIRPAQDA